MRSTAEVRRAGESPARQVHPSPLPAEARGRLGREVAALPLVFETTWLGGVNVSIWDRPAGRTELLQARRVRWRPARPRHAARGARLACHKRGVRPHARGR